MNIHIIRKTEELDALKNDWEDLWERSSTTPFQTPAWLLSWWKTLGSGDLLSIAVYSENRLLALAPLYIESRSGDRNLLFLGTGHSDYLGFLIDESEKEILQALIFKEILKKKAHWDHCVLQEMREPISYPQDASVSVKKELQSYCPVIARSDLIPTLFKKADHSIRRLEKNGKVSIKESTLETLGSDLQDFFDLHAKRWSEKQMPGALAEADVQSFHRLASRELMHMGLLRLYRILVGEQLLAIHYGFSHKGRAYLYLCGFNPQFSKYSPGVILVSCVIRESLKEGLHEIDFLRGQESYKYLWGAKDTQTYCMKIEWSKTRHLEPQTRHLERSREV